MSYFPNYKTTPRESFVYFENDNGVHGEHLPHLHQRPLVDDGRRDVDGDGDIDLALGNYTTAPTKPSMCRSFSSRHGNNAGRR